MPKSTETTAPRSRGRPRQERATRPRARAINLTDAELLARAIKDAGMSDTEFAGAVLKCHPRTLRKYLAGRDLPPLAREKLLSLVEPGR